MNKQKKTNSVNRKSRCCGRTKMGKPCEAAATAGGLCYFHANPKKARELGRKGGRKNRRLVIANSVTLRPSDVPADPLARLEYLYQGVDSGRIAPEKAKAMLPIVVQQIRLKEHHDLAERVATLEKIIQERSQSNFELERSGTATPFDGSGEDPAQ